MLKRYALASFAALVLAACGSKSQPTTAPPPAGSDTTMAGGSAETGGEPGGGTGAGTGTGTVEPPVPPAPPAPDPAKIKADLLAAEQDAFQKAKPVFDQYCAKCHTQTGKAAKKKTLEHFDMTSYPFGGHHALVIGPEVREALGLSGEKPKMPKDKPGLVKGDELALIDAWTQAWIKADEGGAHGEKSTKDKLDSDK